VRRAAPTLALVTVFLAGCSGHHHTQQAATASAPGAPPPELSSLASCHPEMYGNKCATLTVPLDHSGKVDGTLDLRVSVSGPADAPRGTALFLTGGPGEAGVLFAPRIEQELRDAVKGYRVVMLDQRGTGGGALDCRALQKAVGASDLAVPPAAAVRSCAAKIGPRRRFFTTADTVADLDSLRAALGVKRWAAVDGVSYGTFVAERYALAHPGNVSRLVLDSVVPHVGIEPFQLETIHAVPRVLRSACRQEHCGSDPVADLAAVIRQRHDGPALLDTLVTLSIADPDYRAVPRALAEARAGRPRRLDRLIRGTHHGDSLPASFLSSGLHASTLCADYPFPWGGPSTPVTVRRPTIARIAPGRLTPAAVAPFDRATATGNGELVTCENWPPEPLRAPRVPRELPDIPVLLLNGDRDLSTPLVWAQEEGRAAPRGQLVVSHGDGHSVQLRGQDPASRRALVRFLQSR
jgi:pimeloyl-ACP methyl ester carboxylesterase